MGVRLRRVLVGLVLLVVTAGTLAAVSLATTTSGHQNPRYLVTTSLTPTNVPWHGDFRATVTVKNTSPVRRTLAIEYAVLKPGSGSGFASAAVKLRPAQVWSRALTIHANARGDYSLTIKARDRAGTSRAT